MKSSIRRALAERALATTKRKPRPSRAVLTIPACRELFRARPRQRGRLIRSIAVERGIGRSVIYRWLGKSFFVAVRQWHLEKKRLAELKSVRAILRKLTKRPSPRRYSTAAALPPSVCRAVFGASPRERSRIIGVVASERGLSKGAVYNWLARHRWPEERAKRDAFRAGAWETTGILYRGRHK